MLHSTETALVRVQYDIASELDKNHAMLFVMLDLLIAFDMIDHKHLLTLLHDEFGIIIVLDFLGRPHPLCPNRYKTSATIHLLSGMPQG